MKNKFEPTISKEELYQKPLIHFDGRIHIIDNPVEAKNAIIELKGIKNKIALLQFATDNDAFLFRIFKYFPQEIIEILESDFITKIGTAIHDDIKGLQKYKRFNPDGFVELQDFVKKFNIENNGLKKLSAIVLGSRISKGQQTSNWENQELSEAQLKYAATDAWICLEIYNKLNSFNK